MVDPAIENFFRERKESWLKKNIKGPMDEKREKEKHIECEKLFSPEVWLPNAANRARQMSLATHPCTFSHPSARKNKNGYATPVLANAEGAPDGYIRSGNVNAEIDALGNAAALDVYKFLMLEMADKKKLIEHIQKDTQIAVQLLTVANSNYKSLKDGFLKMVEASGNTEVITSSKMKQVYFPVEKAYHQLSLLSNSGIIFEMKKRIDALRFSEKAKELRGQKRNNMYNNEGFAELYNLTTIGYGGTKPQNISVLNNQNGGKAYLLLSAPPTFDNRDIHFPKSNFFKESFHNYEYRDIFYALHRLFKTEYNNKRIREGRDYRLQDLMARIIDRMWAARSVCSIQYRPENSRLKLHQKIWLCEEYRQIREDEDAWLDKLCNEIAGWTIRTYGQVLGKQAYKLDESVRQHVLKIVTSNMEALR